MIVFIKYMITFEAGMKREFLFNGTGTTITTGTTLAGPGCFV